MTIHVDAETRNSHTHRFERLARHTAYPEIRKFLAEYIEAFIPDPVGSQRQWVLTAYPATASGRLLTLSIGKMEVLYVAEGADAAEGDKVLVICLNMLEAPDVRHALDELVSSDRDLAHSDPPAEYSTRAVVNLVAYSIESARSALLQESVGAASRDLAESLLADGNRTYGRYHNQKFASDILDAIAHLTAT